MKKYNKHNKNKTFGFRPKDKPDVPRSLEYGMWLLQVKREQLLRQQR